MLVRITCYDVCRKPQKKDTIWETKPQENSPNSGYGPVAGPCKHYNRPSGEIKQVGKYAEATKFSAHLFFHSRLILNS